MVGASEALGWELELSHASIAENKPKDHRLLRSNSPTVYRLSKKALSFLCIRTYIYIYTYTRIWSVMVKYGTTRDMTSFEMRSLSQDSFFGIVCSRAARRMITPPYMYEPQTPIGPSWMSESEGSGPGKVQPPTHSDRIRSRSRQSGCTVWHARSSSKCSRVNGNSSRGFERKTLKILFIPRSFPNSL